jgi:hypothetical protein
MDITTRENIPSAEDRLFLLVIQFEKKKQWLYSESRISVASQQGGMQEDSL